MQGKNKPELGCKVRLTLRAESVPNLPAGFKYFTPIADPESLGLA